MVDALQLEAVRRALTRLVTRGTRAVWDPDVQPLLALPAVQSRIDELGESHAADALLSVIRDAVADMGTSQHAALLTIVLALDPRYEGLSVATRRRLAGKRFRGGEHPVAAGTIRQHHEPKALAELASELLRSSAEPHALTRTAEGIERRTPQQIEWHPAVHEAWAAEQLCFWRLSLELYERADVLERVSDAMQRSGVRSWAMWELLGAGDLLLRTWLSTPQHEVERALLDALRNQPDLLIDPFAVTEIVTHWPWTARPAIPMHQPAPALLESPPPARELAQTACDAPTLARAERAGLVISIPRVAGIGFLVAIGKPRRSSRAFSLALRQQLVELLDRQEHLSAVSVYGGFGWADYLVQGVVATTAFEELAQSLLPALRELVTPLGCRTWTGILAPDPIVAVERIADPIDDAGNVRSAAELLQQDEGLLLEVKATAFSSLHTRPATRDDHDRSAVDALLRTIAGMANAQGGTIVIGALERVQARMLEDEPIERLPQVGRYLVRGIDHEMTRGWDVYERRIRESVRAAITPDPSFHLELRRELIESRTLCLVSVHPRSQAQAEWYYHRSPRSRHHRFYVRDGDRTRELDGPDADVYRRMWTAAPAALGR